ncbi:MAG: type II toxin-antitoxin system prevent-host-death family antitoxin [Gemmatimonadota bacterium]|nr:type II toxin-antitoxin system prevent-host-death family antitoxin [Gemmatimonadota bacterium]
MKTYSTYEAKAKFSEILRQVRQGRTVFVSYRGSPVAEIRPVGGAEASLARRLARLEERGVVVRPPARTGDLDVVRRRPGALARFLEERDE